MHYAVFCGGNIIYFGSNQTNALAKLDLKQPTSSLSVVQDLTHLATLFKAHVEGLPSAPVIKIDPPVIPPIVILLDQLENMPKKVAEPLNLTPKVTCSPKVAMVDLSDCHQ